MDECAAKGNIPIWQKARRLEAWDYTDKAYRPRLITLVAYEGRLRLYSRTLPGCRVNIYSKLGCSSAKYRGFCKKYRPKLKPETRNYWGSKLLAGLKAKKKVKKSSPGQMRLPWDEWEATNEEVENFSASLFLLIVITRKLPASYYKNNMMLQKCPVPGNGNLEPAILRR